MNDEINEDEVFEKKESKIKPKLEKIFKNKKILSAIIAVIIIAVIVILEFTTNMISGLFYGMGNTVGNISNCGYSVAKGDTIYYVAPSEDMKTINIYKSKTGSTDLETIFEGNYDIRALNIVGNKLYFINISYEEEVQDGDSIDNKIYRMNLDGSNQEIINDNEFAYDSYEMYVVKNRIYYVGEDKNVYSMNLNGGNRKLVAETGTGFLCINEKYIVYNKENDDGSDYITYIKSLNKNDERQINGTRMFTPDIYKDDIYYMNEEHNILKTNINGGEETTISDVSAYNMNIYDGNIYYLSYKDEKNEDYTVCINRISTDGGEPELVKEFSYYSSFIDLVNGYIYYMDMDDEKAFINLVNINDKSETRLYDWDYGKNQTSQTDEVIDTADISEETTEEIETEENNQ